MAKLTAKLPRSLQAQTKGATLSGPRDNRAMPAAVDAGMVAEVCGRFHELLRGPQLKHRGRDVFVAPDMGRARFRGYGKHAAHGAWVPTPKFDAAIRAR